MRNAATHNGKDLAREIALLRQQLDELADTVSGTGGSLVARGEAALEETLKSARELVAKYGDTAKSIADDTAKLKSKATDALIEQTETRPLTTFAAIIGIGFLAGWLCRRQH
jgi:ElaB/YqjD/DUF883 family membrane-anchored ribosome-binding protein